MAKLIKPTFPYLPKGQRTRNFLSRELNRIKFLRIESFIMNLFSTGKIYLNNMTA